MARSQRGVVCTTPEAVKSLMLMNVDILSIIEQYERDVVAPLLLSKEREREERERLNQKGGERVVVGLGKNKKTEEEITEDDIRPVSLRLKQLNQIATEISSIIEIWGEGDKEEEREEEEEKKEEEERVKEEIEEKKLEEKEKEKEEEKQQKETTQPIRKRRDIVLLESNTSSTKKKRQIRDKTRAGKGIVLLDEVDVILHPLFSELNFPIGKKESLPLSPERWEFPVFLFERILRVVREERERRKKGGKEKIEKEKEGEVERKEEAILRGLREKMREGRERRGIQLSPHFVLLDRSFYEKELSFFMANISVLWVLEQSSIQVCFSLFSSLFFSYLISFSFPGGFDASRSIN